MKSLKIFESVEEAFESVKWMFQEMTSVEESKLKDHLNRYFLSDSRHVLEYKKSYKWAVIWWDKVNDN